MRQVGLLCALAACAGSERAGGTSAVPDRCTAAALGIAGHEAPAYRAPAGCTLAVPDGADLVVANEAAAATAITCATGVDRDLDVSREGVVARQTLLSPAAVGYRLIDDGATLTFVSMQRSPCPDDPRPMPTPATFAFRIDQPAAPRAVVERACTIASPPCR